MQKPIILVGGGGHCQSVIEGAESEGKIILGILEIPSEFGKEVLPGHNVIGCDDDMSNYVGVADFINTIGFISNLSLRLKISEKINLSGGTLASVIASTAHVSRYAKVGKGTVILHHVTVNAAACIGDNCIINTSSNIEHACIIGEQTHISTGAMINGDCRIGSQCFIGSGAIIGHGVNICDHVIIGCGTVVIHNITQPGTYVGNPAKRIK